MAESISHCVHVMCDRVTALPPSMHRRVECEWGILRSGEVPRSNGGRRSGSLDSCRGEGGARASVKLVPIHVHLVYKHVHVHEYECEL